MIVALRLWLIVQSGWIDQSFLVDFPTGFRFLAEEAAWVAFVASGSVLLNEQQNRIGIAIDTYFDDFLSMPAFFAFAPKPST
jgi:hypothetical protein